jgi:hypothetical protein
MRSRTASFRCARELAPSDDYPTRIVGCIVLALMVIGFFWIFGLTFHPNDLQIWNYAPKQAVASHEALGRSPLIAPVAPEPDMHSASIRFANSDVIGQPTQAEQSPQVDPSSERKITQPARHISKPKVISRLPVDAANAYASARHYYARPEIGAE